ncbi:hypothetical protein [Rhodococcus kronopolitis]|uniref:Uncharacterized protein n=1 Tax=Rhodococcus kronopolitis TaxID=1460226 RepID=A0ABV9FVW3_9NOCA
MTAYLPKGSQFLSVDVKWYEPGVVGFVSAPAPETSVDEKTGAVTFTGSWPMNSFVTVQYSVPLTARVGSVLEGGFGITVAGLEARDWPVLEENGTTISGWCEYPDEPNLDDGFHQGYGSTGS